MICPICKSENDDGSAFCTKCGAKLEQQNANSPKSNQVPQNTEYGEYGFTPPYIASTKTKSRKKTIIIVSIALLLVAAIITAVVVAAAYSGPITTIYKALDKTANAKSLSFSGEIRSLYESVTLEGTVVFQPKKRILELYMEGKNTDRHGNMDTFMFIIINNILIMDEGDYIWSEDISEDLNDFFDEYGKHTSAGRVEDVDWKQIFNYLEIDSDNINYNLFGKLLKGFIWDMNNEEYINQKIADYTVEKKNNTITHSFRFDADVLSKELTSVFGEAFNFKDEDSKKDFQEDFRNIIVQSTGDTRFGVHIDITGSYLSRVVVDMKTLYIRCEMRDFGKAKIEQNVLDKYSDYLK